MGIKIALISANRLRDPYPVYPLGTAYLKAYLEANMPDCAVEVLDMNFLTEEALGKHLQQTSPDYVCVSIRNVDGANSLDRRAFYGEYRKITDVVRASSHAPLIIGGAGFSIFPDQFVAELNADYGISGEGEQALYNLIQALRKGEDTTVLSQIPNLHIAHQTHTGNRCPLYITAPQAVYEPQLVEYYWKESGMLNIQTKRGCPYHCVYCSYPEIDGRRVRTMQVEGIVETLQKAKKDFNINYWFFTDSVFNIKNTYNQELCEAIIKSGVNISWGAYFSPSNIKDEEMALYKRSGLTHIEFGTESFCDETLKTYGKNFTFSDVLHCSELALKHNVFYSHFMILAGYGENEKQRAITFENSKRLAHTVIFPFVGMRIYPNTQLHDLAIADGTIHHEFDLLLPTYYIAKDFDLERSRSMAKQTEKAWIFPDEPQSDLVKILKHKKNKKGPLWEYLRKP